MYVLQPFDIKTKFKYLFNISHALLFVLQLKFFILI